MSRLIKNEFFLSLILPNVQFWLGHTCNVIKSLVFLFYGPDPIFELKYCFWSIYTYMNESRLNVKYYMRIFCINCIYSDSKRMSQLWYDTVSFNW
jgi:hypothetical protein